jgi:DtxR family Mn-dependent transcriptional regulator
MPDPGITLLWTAILAGIAVLLFRPGKGIYHRLRKARQMTGRVLTEDALKHIHHCEMDSHFATAESLAGALNISVSTAMDILIKMEASGLLRRQTGIIQLTPSGRDYALRIIRAHRLWERYLADETGYREEDWHNQAEQYEHTLSPEEIEALAAQLGNPTHDPHGDPIPTASGDYVSHGGKPLSSIPIDRAARIVHIEDEPAAVYAQLVAEGLYPGMNLRVMEITPQSVRFWAHGDEHVLAPVLADNISVVLESQPVDIDSPGGKKLSVLEPGQSGIVKRLSPAMRGLERRRMMDLGIIPGTEIKVEMASPVGDPTAYRIRGALIALRREQADLIYISPQEEVRND